MRPKSSHANFKFRFVTDLKKLGRVYIFKIRKLKVNNFARSIELNFKSMLQFLKAERCVDSTVTITQA